MKSKNAELWEHVETNLIRYKPTGGYYVKAKVHGKKVRESLDTDKLAEARRQLSAWMAKVRGGNSRVKSALLMQALVEEWKLWLENKVQAPRTRKCRLDNWRVVIEPTWPHILTTKISSITRHDVESWRDSLITKHGYSHSQANQCLGTLKQIFRIGESKGLMLNDSPAIRVKQLRPTKKKLVLPTKQEFAKLRFADQAGIYLERQFMDGGQRNEVCLGWQRHRPIAQFKQCPDSDVDAWFGYEWKFAGRGRHRRLAGDDQRGRSKLFLSCGWQWKRDSLNRRLAKCRPAADV